MGNYVFFRLVPDVKTSKKLKVIEGQIDKDGKSIPVETLVASSVALIEANDVGSIFAARKEDVHSVYRTMISARPLFLICNKNLDLSTASADILAMRKEYDKFIHVEFSNEEFNKKKELSLFEKIQIVKSFQRPVVDKDGFFVEQLNWSVLVANTMEHINTLLYGPSGTGKTMLAIEVAKRLNIPIHIIDCGSLHDPMSQLLGTHRLVVDPISGQTVSKFEYAPLCEYIKTPGIIVLDEINRSNASNIFLPLLDDRRYLDVAMAGEQDQRHIPVHEGCVFFATANVGLEYSGTQSIDRALKDRFVLMELDYLPEAAETSLLMYRYGIQEVPASLIVSLANKIRSMFRNGELSIEVSTRHTLLVARYVSLGLDIYEALKFVFLPLFEKGDGLGGERTIVQNILLSR